MEKTSSLARNDIIIFACRFFPLVSCLFLILGIQSNDFFFSLNALTARMLGETLRLLGLDCLVSGYFVSRGGLSIQVITECSALYFYILYVSFLTAYPAPWWKKLLGFFFGLPAILLANQLRLLIIFLVGLTSKGLFEIAHIYFGQIFMVSVSFLACLSWLQLIVERQSLRPLPDFLIRFVAFSSLPFLLWIFLNKPFITFLDAAAVAVLQAIGITSAAFPTGEGLHYHTFNIATFCGLVMASSSLRRQEKVRTLALGGIFMILTHFLLRLTSSLILLQNDFLSCAGDDDDLSGTCRKPIPRQRRTGG